MTTFAGGKSFGIVHGANWPDVAQYVDVLAESKGWQPVGGVAVYRGPSDRGGTYTGPEETSFYQAVWRSPDGRVDVRVPEPDSGAASRILMEGALELAKTKVIRLTDLVVSLVLLAHGFGVCLCGHPLTDRSVFTHVKVCTDAEAEYAAAERNTP